MLLDGLIGRRARIFRNIGRLDSDHSRGCLCKNVTVCIGEMKEIIRARISLAAKDSGFTGRTPFQEPGILDSIRYRVFSPVFIRADG
jgi:hypothetical protein